VPRHRAAVLFGLFLAAIALRPQIIAVGPLLPTIRHDLGVSHAVAGLLGTIPVLCMGLFAPSAASLAARFGTRATIGVSVALIGAGGLARVATADPYVLLLFTFPVGLGIAIAGTLMPMAVKERFPHRPAFATSVYTLGIQIGAAGSAAAAVPLSHAVSGYRGSLAVISATAVVVAVGWLLLSGGVERHAVVRRAPLPLRNSTAWLLVLVFSVIGIVYYGLSSWLGAAYQEHGWSESSAGLLLTTVQAVTVPTVVVVAFVGDRLGSRRLFLGGATLLMLGGLLGVVLAPGGGWAYAALFGVGIGVTFSMLMTLPLDVADDPTEVGAIAGMMMGLGYTISAVSPFLLGAVRDATGSFSDSLWLLVGMEVVLLAAVTLGLSPERLRRGARHAA
jgi:CP family cyanate transporter-like MFS transporter